MLFGGLQKITLIDYPGKVASMVYTIGCNFRCPYCHNPELVDETVEARFPEAEIFDFLKSRKGIVEGLVITGGEPTMHEDLPDFMRKVKKMGFLVKLDSNGTNPEMLKYVIDKMLVDYIAMDIKAPLYKYSQAVARPVDPSILRRSIKLIKSSGIPYEFRTTVVKFMLSPEDMEEIVEEIKGADKYFIQKFISTRILNPQFKKKTSYDDKELKHFQKLFAKKVKFCGIR